ncbi:hypothetical protein CSPAE12_08050 [Colletotrichum incanum]|nr:hypothetical protein CSPAE12_08050 [Colletotrichum incanum]
MPSLENFWWQLPRIFLSIATSQFVTIDIDMTETSIFKILHLGFTCTIASQVFEIPLFVVFTDGSYETEAYSFGV